MVYREEQRLEDAVEEIDPAERHRADRVSVIAAAEHHELAPVLVPAELVVLEGHLEGDLHRGRVGKNTRASPRGDGGERSAHSMEAEQADSVECTFPAARIASSISGAVAVHVAPERRDTVE
jgi:hypothetical protein